MYTYKHTCIHICLYVGNPDPGGFSPPPPGGGLNPEPPRPPWAVGPWPLAPPRQAVVWLGGGGVCILKAVKIPIWISIL